MSKGYRVKNKNYRHEFTQVINNIDGVRLAVIICLDVRIDVIGNSNWRK